MMHIRSKTPALLALLTCSALAGCLEKRDNLHYFGGPKELEHYKQVANEITYPDEVQPPAEQTKISNAPRTIQDRSKDEVYNLSLEESLQLALRHNKIVRTLSTSGTLLVNPDNAPSVFDPSIQASGVLFGRRGVEAALADFDATFTTSMLWGKDERYLNSPAINGFAQESQTDSAAFRSALSKNFAYGGNLTLAHDWDYAGTGLSPGPNNGNLFDSAYRGNARAEYRQPLLAGAGAEYTRIAGPANPNFGAIAGVSQGVVISRINHDITLADFELSVRNMLYDVEQTYWNLYLAYCLYDTAIQAHNSAQGSWEKAKNNDEVGEGTKYDEPQARDRFYETRSQVERALNNIYTVEARLRQLLNMPVNDGRIFRPCTEPSTSELSPDWQVTLCEALVHRVELRKQKWNIQSLELQLTAAKSLTKPRLDFVSSYQVNGFGDNLLGESDDDNAGTTQGLDSAYETLTQGDQTGWTTGLQFSMPVGFRSARAQVRNYELRIAKARAALAAQEVDVSHELGGVFQNLTVQYQTAETNFNRLRAAERRVAVLDDLWDGGQPVLDELLRAQESLSFAQRDYCTSLIEYNKAISGLHFFKGTLLQHYNVCLAEDEWAPKAYRDALERAWARTYAFDNYHLETEPPEFGHHPPISGQEMPTLAVDEFGHPLQGEPLETPIPTTEDEEKKPADEEKKPADEEKKPADKEKKPSYDDDVPQPMLNPLPKLPMEPGPAPKPKTPKAVETPPSLDVQFQTPLRAPGAGPRQSTIIIDELEAEEQFVTPTSALQPTRNNQLKSASHTTVIEGPAAAPPWERKSQSK